MAAALSITTKHSREVATLALTGGPATANVTFVVTDTGAGTVNIPATTSGAGAVTVTYVPMNPGTLSVTVIAPQATNAVVGPVTAQVGVGA